VLETTIPLTTVHEVAMPITEMKETKITKIRVPEITYPIAILSPGVREPFQGALRRLRKLENIAMLKYIYLVLMRS